MRALRISLACAALVVGGLSVAARAQDPAAATEKMLKAESLGPLRLGLAEASLLKALGKPAKKGALVYQGADGTYVQDWHYPAQGLDLWMSAGEKKTGAKTIASFTAKAPNAFATKQGVRIGSGESAVRKAYGAHADKESPAEPGTFVAGSIYGGIIFNFNKGKVTRIFFGAAAE